MFARSPHVRMHVILALTSLLTVIIILTSGLLTGVLQAEPPEQTTDGTATVRDAQGETRTLEAGDQIRVQPSRKALMEEIHLILEEQREDIAQLRVSFDKSTSPEQALELQRRIEQRKRDAEISIYAAQIVYLKQLGREDSVAKLEEAIRRLQDPESGMRPVDGADRQR